MAANFLNPMAGFLSPDEQSAVQGNSLLQLAGGLLSGSGWQPHPVTFGSIFGQAAMPALQAQQQMTGQMLQMKHLKNQIDLESMMMPYKLAAIQDMVGSPPQAQAPTPTATDIQGNQFPVTQLPPYLTNNPPAAAQAAQQTINTQSQMMPVQTQSGTQWFDPQRLYRIGMDQLALGNPGGATLVDAALSHNPALVAQMETAKINATLPQQLLLNAARGGAMRPVVLSPGQTAQSPFPLLPPMFQQGITNALGGQPSSGVGQAQPMAQMPSSAIPARPVGGSPNRLEGQSPLVVESQKALASNLEEQYKGWQGESDKAQTDNLTLQKLLEDSQSWNPNAMASNWAKVKAALNAVDPDHKIFSKSLGDYQQFEKNAVVLSTSAARNMGAREPGSVIQMFRQAYPNADVTRNALNGIVTQFMGTNDYKAALTQAADAWRNSPQNKAPGTLLGFKAQFNKVVDPNFFVVRRMPPEVRQKYFESMTPGERANFQKRYSAALNSGFMSSP